MGSLTCPARFLKGAAPECAVLPKRRPALPYRLDLPPDLTVPAGSTLAAWAVPNGTRWVGRQWEGQGTNQDPT